MSFLSEPVIEIIPVTDDMREHLGLPGEAHLAIIETYCGVTEILSTDDQCTGPGKNGIVEAARRWAESCGAAFAEAGAA